MRYHKNTQHLCRNRHKYLILTQCQSIFYVHKTSMMVDHCIHHKQIPLIHLRYISLQIYNVQNLYIMDINSTFWHRAKIFFTSLKSLLLLITVRNKNRINPFFSEILQQTQNLRKILP